MTPGCDDSRVGEGREEIWDKTMSSKGGPNCGYISSHTPNLERFAAAANRPEHPTEEGGDLRAIRKST